MRVSLTRLSAWQECIGLDLVEYRLDYQGGLTVFVLC